MAATSTRPNLDEVRAWLAQVPDPEIPAVSVTDLGIVRDVRWQDDELVVAITPTYSGCPAMAVIAQDIERALQARGIARVRIETRLAPAWTTDWLSEAGRRKLHDYGIAPPAPRADPKSGIRGCGGSHLPVACPHCGSVSTRVISHFGSTPCKALHRCDDCLEPFDHFKCH
jgi:ring-1,2-phenylacetyl-CoA epoxidase subunit PaaD